VAAPKRNSAEIARDRRLIAHLYLNEKISQPEIAEQLNDREGITYTLTQQMVSYDLTALQAQWLKAALMDLDEAKAQELARINRLELEYWAAWERSCENAEIETKKAKGKVQQYQDEQGRFVAEQPAEVTKQSKGQAGDPRFLQGVQWCIERRCKILGIDAAGKVDVTTGGTPLTVVFSGLKPDDV